MHAFGSEIIHLVAGAVVLCSLLWREYASLLTVSNDTALADTPREAIRRALVLAFKTKVSRFISIDKSTVEDYRRFRRIVDLLSFLMVLNVVMLGLIAVGLLLIIKKDDIGFSTQPEYLLLMIGYVATFVVGYGATDRLRDTVRERQSNPAFNGRVREQPSERQAVRPLPAQEDAMRKPKTAPELKADEPYVPPQPAVLYPSLNEAERTALRDDPEAVKRDLIAAGILDEHGEIKGVYKRA